MCPEILPPGPKAGAPTSTLLAVVSRPAEIVFQILPGDPALRGRPETGAV